MQRSANLHNSIYRMINSKLVVQWMNASMRSISAKFLPYHVCPLDFRSDQSLRSCKFGKCQKNGREVSSHIYYYSLLNILSSTQYEPDLWLPSCSSMSSEPALSFLLLFYPFSLQLLILSSSLFIFLRLPALALAMNHPGTMLSLFCNFFNPSCTTIEGMLITAAKFNNWFRRFYTSSFHSYLRQFSRNN